MKDLKKDFLKISERLQRYAYKTSKLHMVFISESSGKVMTNIVVMGFGIRKKKEVIFYLNDEMTFTKTMFQRYHIPWYHDEIQKTVLLDYNIYHLKIIKREDCIKRYGRHEILTQITIYNLLDASILSRKQGYS